MSAPSIDPAVGALIIVAIALLFATAATHKLRDLRRFGEIFSAYGLLPPVVGRRLSGFVPLAEIAVACGLLLNVSRTYAVFLGAACLLAYAGAIAINLRRGRRDLACGCGGPDERRPIAAWMVWRNVLLCAVLLSVMLPWSLRALQPTDLVTVTFGTLTCALVYACLDRLLGQAARRTAELRAG
jgi:hypothetical protein